MAATWMPHGSWDKTASKLKGWARAQEEEDLDVSLDGPAEAERAFGALSAAQFGAALAAYSAAQEREEARRLMYVALTRASRSLLLAMRVSAKIEDGYENTWVTGDVFDALGWAMDDGASVAMMDFGGRAPARVASERVLAEVGEETGGEPLAASAPTGEERLDEELGAAAARMPLPSSRLSGERMAKTRRSRRSNFAREGLYSYTSLSGAHPHSDEPAVEADEGVVLLHEGRSALGWAMRANLRSLTMLQRLVNLTGPLWGAGICHGPGHGVSSGPAGHRAERAGIALRSQRGSHPGADSEGGPVGGSAGALARGAHSLARQRRGRLRFSYENRRAEVPFTVAIGGFFLEGEIDGLADNGDGGRPSSSTTRPAAATTRRPSSSTRSTASRRAATPMRSCARATSRWRPTSCASSDPAPTTRAIRRSFRTISRKPTCPPWKRL
ncbi:MAG: hypothetical protein V8Q09_04410 [Adlercreutzia sp.]